MKFLLDMNLPPRWVQFLSDHGFKCVHWSNVGEYTAKDSVIMADARHFLHRGSRPHKKDPQAPWTMGGKYTRRTSSHEPTNLNAAWRVIFALFRSKRILAVNLGLAPPYVHSRYTSGQPLRAPQSSCLHYDVPSLPLTHKAGILYVPSQ